MIDLEALFDEAQALEPLPASVPRLARAVAVPEPDFGELEEIIALDEALTMRLLELANSTAGGASNQVVSVRDAAVRVGPPAVLSVATGIHASKALRVPLPQYGLDEDEMWEHAVAASLAADLLAERSQASVPPEATTAALLHDVGKLVFRRFLDPDVLASIAEATASGLTQSAAEIAVLGIDHAHAGSLVATAWNLPERIAHAIGVHHHPDEARDLAADVVHLADLVAKAIGCGLGDVGLNLDARAQSAARLGLDDAQLASICAETSARFDEVKESYG